MHKNLMGIKKAFNGVKTKQKKSTCIFAQIRSKGQ